MDWYRFGMICAWCQDVSSSGVEPSCIRTWASRHDTLGSGTSAEVPTAPRTRATPHGFWMLQDDSVEYSMQQCQLHFSCRIDKGFEMEMFAKLELRLS